MDAAILILLMLSIVVGQVAALRRFWLNDRPGFIRSATLFAYYFVYIAVGFSVLVLLADLAHQRRGNISELHDDANLAALLGFMISWAFLGGSFLVKTAPRLRTVPAWIDRSLPVLDLLALGIMAVGVLTVFL